MKDLVYFILIQYFNFKKSHMLTSIIKLAIIGHDALRLVGAL